MIQSLQQDIIGLTDGTDLEYSYTFDNTGSSSSKSRSDMYEICIDGESGCRGTVDVKWTLKSGTKFVKNGSEYLLKEDAEIMLFDVNLRVNKTYDVFTRLRADASGICRYYDYYNEGKETCTLVFSDGYKESASRFIYENRLLKFNFKGDKTFKFKDGNTSISRDDLDQFCYTIYDGNYNGHFSIPKKFKFYHQKHVEMFVDYAFPVIIDTTQNIENVLITSEKKSNKTLVTLDGPGMVSLVRKFSRIKVDKVGDAKEAALVDVDTKLTNAVTKEVDKVKERKEKRIETKAKNDSIKTDTEKIVEPMKSSTKLIIYVGVVLGILYILYGTFLVVYYRHIPKDLKQRLAEAAARKDNEEGKNQE